MKVCHAVIGRTLPYRCSGCRKHFCWEHLNVLGDHDAGAFGGFCDPCADELENAA